MGSVFCWFYNTFKKVLYALILPEVLCRIWKGYAFTAFQDATSTISVRVKSCQNSQQHTTTDVLGHIQLETITQKSHCLHFLSSKSDEDTISAGSHCLCLVRSCLWFYWMAVLHSSCCLNVINFFHLAWLCAERKNLVAHWVALVANLPWCLPSSNIPATLPAILQASVS